jgi:hypothetical protein
MLWGGGTHDMPSNLLLINTIMTLGSTKMKVLELILQGEHIQGN